MKNIFMKAFGFFVALGYFGVALAVQPANSCCCPQPKEPRCEAECKACEICPPCEPCEPCCTEVPTIGEPCSCAYNAPARIDPLCGWDAWLSISFIYWQPYEKGLDIANLTKSLTNTTDMYIVDMDFDYHPGFKIGAGMSFCRDNWTLYLEYTRLKADNCYTEDITILDETVYALHTPWLNGLTVAGTIDIIKSEWEVSYNAFDLELGRPFYLGSKLIFKPHFGLRAGWLDQDFDLYVHTSGEAGGESYFSDNDQNTWFIGPRAGVCADWMIGYDFRIFGSVAGSLLYQDFDVDSEQSYYETAVRHSYNIYDDVKRITPNAELGLGIGYGTYICNSTWHFDLTAGYEFHYFWDQNMMRHNVDYMDNYYDVDSGDLMFQGLTITARLDF